MPRHDLQFLIWVILIPGVKLPFGSLTADSATRNCKIACMWSRLLLMFAACAGGDHQRTRKSRRNSLASGGPIPPGRWFSASGLAIMIWPSCSSSCPVPS
jgi:hypothetical protein